MKTNLTKLTKAYTGIKAKGRDSDVDNRIEIDPISTLIFRRKRQWKTE